MGKTLIFHFNVNIHEKNGTREASPGNREIQIIKVQIIELRLYNVWLCFQ